jgi:transposase
VALIVRRGHAEGSHVLPGELRVARRGPGRPRTTPDVLRADRAECSRGHRELLRSRGIGAVIAEKADQAADRERCGRTARTVTHGAAACKNRNVVERFFNRMKHRRAIANRYDKHANVSLGDIVDRLKHIRDTA